MKKPLLQMRKMVMFAVSASFLASGIMPTANASTNVHPLADAIQKANGTISGKV